MNQTNYRPIRLRPALQDYDWGLTGEDCLVARHTAELRRELGLTAKAYAESWFGAHPKGCALALGSNGQFVSLAELIASDPLGYLGTEGILPFQAKFLSIKKPLSIQVHPGVERAKELHRLRSKSYPDPFPKHEAGLAISEVELLYGYREGGLNLLPELWPYLGGVTDIVPGEGQNREVWNVLERLSGNEIETICVNLWKRLKQKSQGLSPEENWVLRLEAAYPQGDIGILFFFLLHYIRLKPGQAVEIPTGRLHAYLSGELAEIMLPGDNVIRVGLTPKEKDLPEISRSSEFRPIQIRDTVVDGVVHGASRHYVFENLGLGVQRFEAGEHMLGKSKGPRILVSLASDAEIKFGAESEIVGDYQSFFLPQAMGSCHISVRNGTLLCFGMAG